MTLLPTLEYRQAQARRWQDEYARHLEQALGRARAWLKTIPQGQVRPHLGSFLTLLDEARRYPPLQAAALALVMELHPLPLRWGEGRRWEAWLHFALERAPDTGLRRGYHNDLAGLYYAAGDFSRATAEAQQALEGALPGDEQAARAVRLLFTVYRAVGKPEEADRLVHGLAEQFDAGLPARQVRPPAARGWLYLNQCRLELLREQGRVEAALALAGEMIWLDEQGGAPDAILTADLYTHRSTLAWVRAAYPAAVADLQHAICLYRQAEDLFNAESLQSNLGLVYWTMGELALAEESLQASIRFYHKAGAQQLLTYDLGNLGLVYFARGDLSRARQWTEEH
ncbi:MAG: tetratricopeptide repeat protein, partial [Chloroflexi bacterium]|nr:tetratricopeptide repeat protein [Chloroflexota bacterium]